MGRGGRARSDRRDRVDLRDRERAPHHRGASIGAPDLSDGLASGERARAVAALAAAGFLAPEAEADALLAASSIGSRSLVALLARRLEGEPLAWITGSAEFCGITLRIDAGVFVPRPQTEALAHRAVDLLSEDGTAVDLCTGSGAVAVVLAVAHPQATVLGTDIDPIAVACAEANGVRTLEGDLDEPLPPSLLGRVDLITAVVPYVPTEELHLLPRDVRAHEPRLALDGGPRGTTGLVRAAEAATRWLRPGGTVLLELGGDQAQEMTGVLTNLGFLDVRVCTDGEGQDRVIEARRGSLPLGAVGHR